jgi:hypothetical protein
MKTKKLLLPLSIAAALGVQAEAMAAEYWLCAKPVTVQIPQGGKKLIDGSQVMKNVIMWGFAEPVGTTMATRVTNANSSFNQGCSGATTTRTPGPRLNVPAGDSTLIVHLKNAITTAQGGEPISLQIPGQAKPTVTGATSTSILGFGEAASGATAATGGVVNYTWTNVKTGTFAYESGSHPQHQIPMGLYGVATHDFATQAVYPGVAYDNEAILIYSEVDPALYRHQNGSNSAQMQVPAADRYGAGSAVVSSINYKPEFYLINGKPFGMGDKVDANSILNNLFAGAPGDLAPVGKTLLRLVNVGLQSHTPNLLGITGQVLAEDGQPYPYPRDHYAVPLPAGSTRDVLIDTPVNTGDIVPLIDRMGGLSAGDPTISTLDPDIVPVDLAQARPDAGMLAKVQFGVANVAVATPDSYTVTEGQSNFNVAAPGVLANDQLGDYFGHGTLEAVIDTPPTQGNLDLLNHTNAQQYPLLPTGRFQYDHLGGEQSSDQFTYHVRVVANSTGPELAGSVLYESTPTTVTINVTPVNDAPVANLNYYVAVRNPGSTDSITAPGSSFLVERIGAAAPFTYPVPTAGILANDTDADGPTPLLVNSFTPVNQTGGALSVDNGTGAVTFTPTVGTPIAAGSRTFTYRTQDSNIPTPGVSAARTGNTLQVVNNTAPTRCSAVTPICTGGAITTPQARITPLSTPVVIDTSTWFTDAQLASYGSIFGIDWSTLSCDVTVAPANAAVSTDGAGTVTFTPTATGTKTYNCWVKDTQGLPATTPASNTNRVQVNLTVNP